MKKNRDSSSRKQSARTNDRTGLPADRRFRRRSVILALGGVAAAAAGAIAWPAFFGSSQAKAGEVVVYKSPSCGCCGNWSMHLRENGFDVSVKDIDNISPIKEQAGVPYDLESCHTAFVDGYVVEGHVPAETIGKMLAERPKIKGLAVPGMPASAPGMDSPDPEPYTVFSFDADGKREVYAAF